MKWILNRTGKQKWSCLALIVCNAVISSFGVIVALLSKTLVDSAVNGDKRLFVLCAVLFGALIVLMLVLKNVYLHLEFFIQTRVDMNLKQHILHQILNKEYQVVGSYHSGDILNRMTEDVNVICGGITMIAPAVTGAVVRLGAAFGVLVFLAPAFAVIFLVLGILVYIGSIFMKRLIKELHKEVQDTNGKVRSFLQEAVANVLPVKVFGMEQTMEEKCGSLLDRFYRVRMKRRTAGIIANSVLGFIFDAGYLFAMVYSGIGLLRHTISFGTLTAMLQLVGQVQSPFSSLAAIMPRYFEMLGSAERIMELENLPDEPLDTAYPGTMETITFSDVDFGYHADTAAGGQETEDAFVLTHVNLQIQKGDKCLITGESGIGKSTLMKLLLGVYHPNAGEIRISDGTHAQTASKATRSLFSYVPQGNMLLSGTVYENLTLVKPDATEAEIARALEISQAKSFVEVLPDGLQTVLGENAYGLSEGQAQRIALARAILADKQVLLLDEATSALDGETEEKLLEAFSALQDKTCLIITHRMAARRICNKQISIENKTCVMTEIESYGKGGGEEWQRENTNRY